MSIAKKSLLIVVLVLIVMQFFPIDKTNPPVLANENFVDMFHTPDSIQTVLKNSCYDCHSNETVYPKYASVAPISYFIKGHINEGREHLNFSEFGTYNQNQMEKVLHEAAEEVEEGEMPMKSYLLMHDDARLNEDQKQMLVNYFNQINQQISNQTEN